MCRPFKFLLFIVAIQRYRSVDCIAPGSLIWSRNLQKFIPISNVSTFGAYEQEIVAKSRKTEKHNFEANASRSGTFEQEIVAKSREKERHNFQGKVLKLGYFEDYTMLHFFDNDTKISGVCGEIWNTLADYSNFTLVTMKVKSLTGWGFRRDLNALDMIDRNEIQIIPRIAFFSKYLKQLDFTTPIWQTRYRIYIQPEWKSDTHWIFNMFENKVWFAILFVFFLLSALGYAIEKISIKVFDDKKRHHNLHDHLFYTFAALCSQGFIPDSVDRRSKILGLSKKIFAWLLLIILSSHVISHMTNVKLQPPFEGVVSLMNNTNYILMSYNGSIAFDNYADLAQEITKYKNINPSRLRHTWTQNMMYGDFGCSHEKRWAIFELEDMKETVGSRFCELVAVGKSYFPTWVTFGVSKGFEYKRTFDIGILKMKEFGLIDRLKNRWLKTPGQTVDAENLKRSAFTPINFNQVLMPFIILSIGIVAAAIIFVLELIVHVYKSNQRRPVRGKELIGNSSLNTRRLPTDNYKRKRMKLEIELPDVERTPVCVVVVRPSCAHGQGNNCPNITYRN